MAVVQLARSVDADTDADGHSRKSRHHWASISMPLVWNECFTITDFGRIRSMVAKASR